MLKCSRSNRVERLGIKYWVEKKAKSKLSNCMGVFTEKKSTFKVEHDAKMQSV